MQPAQPHDPNGARLRLALDRIEAESEQDGTGPRIEFSEQARQDLHEISLRLDDPEAHLALLQKRALEWEESWARLARVAPLGIKLSLSFDASQLAHEPRDFLESGWQSDPFGGCPLGLEVLIESPTVKNDFFRAFVITNASQVLVALGHSDKQDLERASELEWAADQANIYGVPQVIERLLILPDASRLLSVQDFDAAARVFLKDKLGDEAWAKLNVHWHDERVEFWQMLWDKSFFAWGLVRGLYGIGLTIAAATQFKNYIFGRRIEDKNEARLEAERICPALKIAPNQALVENLTKVSILDRDNLIRHFLNLDPDVV